MPENLSQSFLIFQFHLRITFGIRTISNLFSRFLQKNALKTFKNLISFRIMKFSSDPMYSISFRVFRLSFRKISIPLYFWGTALKPNRNDLVRFDSSVVCLPDRELKILECISTVWKNRRILLINNNRIKNINHVFFRAAPPSFFN
jgi:hypothetical protein